MTERLASATSDDLGDQQIRDLLWRFIQRRVPECEVDDLVQTVLCAALDTAQRPVEGEELRRWLIGIARHKIADYHRASRRRPRGELQAEPAVEPAPYEARALAHWAEQAASSEHLGEQTLDWMAREGEGEPLAAIAASERIPAPRIRQRVSRLRRTLKQRWLQELALALGAGLLVLVGWYLVTRPATPVARHDRIRIVSEPSTQRAERIRIEALHYCDQGEWQVCLIGLDQAKRLDPVGDQRPAITEARERAERALEERSPTHSLKDPGPEPTDAPPVIPTGTMDSTPPAPTTAIEPTSPEPGLPKKK